MEEVKKPLTALTAKFQELRAFHEDADQKLANFTTNLEAYEQLHSSLQNNLVAKQSQLNVVIGDRQSMTIDAELLGQDVDKMGALGKELTELDADICCINKLSNLLLENAKDSVTLGNQIAKVNEHFQTIQSDAKRTLQFKIELQRLCTDFSAKKAEFVGKLGEIEARLKTLSSADLLANATEGSARAVLAELDQLEQVGLSQCGRGLNTIKAIYCEMSSVAREFLVVNGAEDNGTLEITVNLGETPTKLMSSLEAAAALIRSLKAEFGERLNVNKGFEALLTELNQFMKSKVDQLENGENELSTQRSKLSTNSEEHERRFTRELERRGEDLTRLVDFYGTKLRETKGNCEYFFYMRYPRFCFYGLLFLVYLFKFWRDF